MGLDYCLFHCTYTIPLVTALSVVYYPFFTREDVFKIASLVTVSSSLHDISLCDDERLWRQSDGVKKIAVLATAPWDSHLIDANIWTYPPTAVLGPTLLGIPVEEVFFFVVHSYTTSVGYCILTKALVRPIYLRPCAETKRVRDLGALVLLGVLGAGTACLLAGGRGTYLGLILTWVSPMLLFQWYCRLVLGLSVADGRRILSYAFLVALPWRPIAVSVCLPTALLWIADARALAAGTWKIESGTKLGYQAYGLDVEEAIFFLATNLMIVGGLVGFDYAFALEEYRVLSTPSAESSLKRTVLGLIQPVTFDRGLISDLSQAVARLKDRSQSMFLGSALFRGQLRMDLIFLYSFCRVMDDLIDEAADESQAQYWIMQCRSLLDGEVNCSRRNRGETAQGEAGACKSQADDPAAQTKLTTLRRAIHLVPLSRMSYPPLHDLLKGFEMDLAFTSKQDTFPIATETDLDRYSSYVASTVATLVLDIIFSHCHENPPHRAAEIRHAGEVMGKALQCLNIARDIHRDAVIGRVYVPTSWLEEAGLSPGDILSCPHSPAVYGLQERLLDKAEGLYWESRGAVEWLPAGVREPVRATVESYMDIGRVLRVRRGRSLETEGKMRVPLGRRLVVGWLAML
ncbi:terpenoid synthase, partial [Aspergillus heteromorphus CBS 117.55]